MGVISIINCARGGISSRPLHYYKNKMDGMRVGISSGFGVLDESDNGRRMINLCVNGDYVWVILTSSTRVCINITGARGQDEVEVINMTDLVLVKKDMLHYVQNVRTVRLMR